MQPSSRIMPRAYRMKMTGVRKLGRPLFDFNHTLRRDKSKYPAISEDEWTALNTDYNELHKRTLEIYLSADYTNDPLDPEMTIDSLLTEFLYG